MAAASTSRVPPASNRCAGASLSEKPSSCYVMEEPPSLRARGMHLLRRIESFLSGPSQLTVPDCYIAEIRQLRLSNDTFRTFFDCRPIATLQLGQSRECFAWVDPTPPQSKPSTAKKSLCPADLKRWNNSVVVGGISGSVNCATVTRRGGVFAGCIANCDYNRPSEFFFCSPNAQVSYLDGHFTASEEAGEVLRSTVGCIKKCSSTETVLSTGTDGRVRCWSESALPSAVGTWLTDSAESEGISSLFAVHPSRPLAVIPSDAGNLYALRFGYSEDGSFGGRLDRFLSAGSSSPYTAKQEAEFLEGGSSFFTLSGWSEVTKAGAVEAYDVETAATAGPVGTYAVDGVELSTMAISRSQNLLAVGTGTDEAPRGDRLVHLADTRSLKGVSKIKTGHRECDVIAVSACERFLVSGDHRTNCASCFDLRNTRAPLFIAAHSNPPDRFFDNQMCAVWSENEPGVLFTGGADSCVKSWDSYQARQLECIPVGHPVNCLASSPDSSVLVIGTCSDVSIFSLFGNFLHPTYEHHYLGG